MLLNAIVIIVQNKQIDRYPYVSGRTDVITMGFSITVYHMTDKTNYLILETLPEPYETLLPQPDPETSSQTSVIL